MIESNLNISDLLEKFSLVTTIMNSDTEQSFDEVGVGGVVTRSRTRKAQTSLNKSIDSSSTSVHQPQSSSSQQLEQNIESNDRSVNR